MDPARARSSDLAPVIAQLQRKSEFLRLEAERLGREADQVDTAITALRKVDPGAGPSTSSTANDGGKREGAGARRVMAPSEKHHHRVHPDRPTSATCAIDQCGKTFAVKKAGRMGVFCSKLCGRRARLAEVRRRLDGPPGADEAIAEQAARVDDLLTQPEPIPESGPGMRERVKRALSNPAPAGPTFLDRARERNDEAARRNGVDARRSA